MVPRRVRALYEAFHCEEIGDPRHSLVRLKVFFAATEKKDYVPEPETRSAPRPVVVFLGAVYADSLRYQWLAEYLVRETGVAAVLAERHCEIFPATPGPAPFLPPQLGTVGESAFIQKLLDKLRAMNEEGVLKGILDLQRIVFGGHSGGGSTALINADNDWFPSLKGAFAYVGHCMSSSKERSSEPSVRHIGGSVPVLLMGGTRDGVIETLGPVRYGRSWQSSMDPIRRSFHEAFEPGRPGYCLEFEGLNHYAAAYPLDSTVGSSQLDYEMEVDEETARELIASTVALFVKEVVFDDDAAAQRLVELVEKPHPLVRSAERRC